MQAGLESVTLHGHSVRLEPLSERHIDELQEAGSDAATWRWLPSAHHAPGTMKTFVDEALTLRDAGRAVPFAIIDKATNSVVGSTRYHCIEPVHRRLEIGFTWISAAFQRTHINTDSKYALLQYAFETLRCRRVEFKVDAENQKSRNAVLRLGAKEEGLFRKHMLYQDGRNRDSIYFSIIDDEWPSVKRKLQLRSAVGANVAPSPEEAR